MLREYQQPPPNLSLVSERTSFRGVRLAARCSFLAFNVNGGATRGSRNNEGLCLPPAGPVLCGVRGRKSHRSLHKGQGGARRVNGGRETRAEFGGC